VWIPGSYSFVGGKYVWIAGGWRLPPSPGEVWLLPRWHADAEGRWSVTAGRWAPKGTLVAPPGGAFTVDARPPPIPAETPPAPPFPGAVWMAGFYTWDGHRFMWVKGRYGVGRPGYFWRPARWIRAGDKYRFEPGRFVK
jgi:hypothetical protein